VSRRRSNPCEKDHAGAEWVTDAQGDPRHANDRCRECHKLLPWSEFYYSSSHGGGHNRTRCTPCINDRKAALATPEEPSLDESWNAVIDVLESLRDHQVSMRSDLNKIMKELGVE